MEQKQMSETVQPEVEQPSDEPESVAPDFGFELPVFDFEEADFRTTELTDF